MRTVSGFAAHDPRLQIRLTTSICCALENRKGPSCRPLKRFRSDLYRTMRLIRRFEEHALELVAAGEIASGIHPCIGQEAVAAGVMAALRPDDLVFSNHRGHGHLLAKGSDPAGSWPSWPAGPPGSTRAAAARSTRPTSRSACSARPAPSATARHWPPAPPGPLAQAGHRPGGGQLLRRRRGDPGRAAGGVQPGRPVAGPGRVRLREQRLRHHAAGRTRRVAGIDHRPGRRVRHPGRPQWTAWTPRSCWPRPARRSRGPGPATARRCWSSRPTGSTGTTRSSIKARLRYRDEAEVAAWRARDPMPLQEPGRAAGRGRRSTPRSRTILDDAVAFALASPRPDPADALAHHYATGLQARAGVAS